jgi:hypothetical protein
MQVVVKARAHLHRSSIVILFGPRKLRMLFGPFFFVQQHAKRRVGIYEQKLSVRWTGWVGKVGCRRRGETLRLRDRLADLSVCLPRGLLAGLVAVVRILAARAAEPCGLTRAS